MGIQARFLLRALLFIAPLLLASIVVEALFWRSGETWPIEMVLKEQRSTGALWMRGIVDQQVPQYKLRMLADRRDPVPIVVLGSSRVLKFRPEMFGLSADEMLNLGSAIQSMRDLELVACMAERVKPKFIIIGVDMWWFNPEIRDGSSLAANHIDDRLAWEAHVLGIRRFLTNGDYGRVLGWLHAPDSRIGAGAIETNTGFRPDGSLRGEEMPPEGAWEFVDREKPPVVDRIRRGTNQFVPSPGIDHERVARFSNVLKQLHSQGIRVAVFLPPFSSQSLDLLQRMTAHRKLFEEFNRIIPKVSENAHAFFVDASSPSRLGLDDRFMHDGFHAEETFHVYLAQKLLSDPGLSASFPEARHAIASAIASPKTNFWNAEWLLH